MLKNIVESNKIKKTTDTNQHKHDSTKHEEYQYLNLIHDIIHEGSFAEGRNGITKSVFGLSLIHISEPTRPR